MRDRNRRPNRTAWQTALIAGLALLATPLAAADFPQNKPLKLLVGATAGGGMDVFTRIVGTRVGENLGRPVVIENRAGGSFVPVTSAVKSAEPDGHTLLIISNSFPMMQGLRPNLPFDLNKDFAPITLVATGPLILITSNNLPVKNLKELLDLARAKPGDLRYGSAGAGTVTHLPAELMMQMAKIQMLHVPYPGGGPALIGLMGGQVDLMFDPVTTLVQHIKSGTVRAIGVSGPKRSDVLPDVPTLSEAGLPGFDVQSWFGVLAPKDTPPEIVKRLQEEFYRAAKMPDIEKRLREIGTEPTGATMPAEFQAYVKSEVDRWTQVIKAAGIQAN